jgi:hypothetical protein
MVGCTRVTHKRYASRPSPPFHAGDCTGQTMKGNDGANYVSVADKRGVYTWKRVQANRNGSKRNTAKSKVYKIHVNGSIPYTVEDSPSQKTATITAADGKITTVKYKNLWPSTKKSQQFGDWEPGNTVLLQKNDGTLLSVYHELVEFKLLAGDSPVEYMSPIGNNDVPYPYLVGANNTYLLNDFVAVPNSALDLTKDVYEQYYEFNDYENSGVKKQAKPLKVKTLRGLSRYSTKN